MLQSMHENTSWQGKIGHPAGLAGLSPCAQVVHNKFCNWLFRERLRCHGCKSRQEVHEVSITLFHAITFGHCSPLSNFVGTYSLLSMPRV